ncbi:MAG: hypothetical protein MSD82_12350 [Prevotella sp.]|nr:hypothetical protein [Prevotella sp.]
MIEVKIFAKNKGRDIGGERTGFRNGSLSTDIAEQAKEAAHAANADIAEQAKEAAHAANADEASHAESAANIDTGSSFWNKVLRKDSDDTAQGVITFLKGIVAKAKSYFTGIENAGNIENSGDIVNSGDIRTKNITVTGKATFFELEILKAKAAGGTTINSPGTFHADIVEETDAGYVLYQRAEQDGKTLTQMIDLHDQLFSCDFNLGTGNYTDAGNHYYWRLVTAAPTEYVTKTINGEDVRCLTVTLSKTDCAASSDVPKAGDDLMVLGHRDDPARQNAMMTSAYRSFDVGLTPPYTAQYIGINNYDLTSHRRSYQASNDNQFVGRMKIVSNGSAAVQTPVPCDLGVWDKTKSYGYYDRVSYTDADGNTSLWLCIVAEGTTTKEVPGTGDAWVKQVSGSVGKSSYTFIRYSNDGGQTFTEASQAAIDATASVPLEGRNVVFGTYREFVIFGVAGKVSSKESYNSCNLGLMQQAGIIISFDLQLTEAVPYLNVFANSKTGDNAGWVSLVARGKSGSTVNNVEPFKEHFIVTVAPRDWYNFYIRLLLTNAAPTAQLIMSNLKVEVGSAATPWTPAPEDCTFGTTEGEYMGTLVWDKPYPSLDPAAYVWSKTKGESITISSTSVTYQVGDSATAAPTGTWQDTVQAAGQGKYLWTKTTVTYSDGKSTTSYTVSRQGVDGTSVQYVLNLSPSVIHVGQDGTMSASSITPKVTKIEGGKGTVSWSATEAWKNGLGVAYKSSQMGAFVWIGNKEEEENKLLFEKLSAVEKVTHIEFQLYSGSQIVDTKYVPFVREAKDGEPGDPGTPGTPGKDGKDAYEVVCTPQSLVFDTDDSGSLDGADYKTVQVSLQTGGNTVDISGKVRLVDGSCINIDSGGIEFGDGPTITVWPNAIDTDDNSVACTSASFMIAIDFDGRTYYSTVLISVNVQAYMSRIDLDAKQYKRTFDEFRGDETSLTKYGSKLLQTAREFSVEMSEKEDRRNLLTGTMFRRREEIAWNNPPYPCMISTSVQYRGTNSVLIDCVAETNADGSAKDKWQGVTWNHIKVTPGKMYQWSFWYRTRTKDLTTEVKAFDANGKELSRPISTTVDTETNADGTWHLFKANFIPTDGTVTVNAMVYITYSGKTYVARPMLEEADAYGGWSPSVNDYDYVGGNMISGTERMDGANISVQSGATKTENGYSGMTSVSGTGYIVNVNGLAFGAKEEYVVSMMAKGEGNVFAEFNGGVYLAESSGGSESAATEKNGVYPATGNTVIPVTSEWQRVSVHVIMSGATSSGTLYVGSTGGSVSIAALKMESGATATDWTDSAETVTYPAGSYGSLFNMTARQIEMSVTDGARKAGLTLGANGGFTATANNFWVKNSSGETIAAVDADGNMQAGSLTTKNKNGQYARIDGTGFELGKTENGSNKVYFDLVQNTNGEAVLRYLDGSGNVIGYIDKNFFNSKSYGDTWTMMQLRWLGSGTDISMSYSQLAEEIALAASGVAQTCYKFNAGFTLSANGTKIYNYTGNSNAPAFENCVYKNKYADASSLGSFANMIEDGWYVSARPLGGLSGNAYDFGSGQEFIVVYRFVGGKYSQSKTVYKNQ